MRIKKNGVTINLTESDIKKLKNSLLKEQQNGDELHGGLTGSDFYVYGKDKVMVGTMDYERHSGKKFLPNEEGTKRGYKEGDDIPEGTYSLKAGIKP